MMILIAAVLAAAQPAPTAQAATATDAHAQHQQAAQVAAPADAHAQHQQEGQAGMMMSEKEMAECRKCCEEMMAKMHEGHSEHSETKPK
jgi:hypothetical protein